MVAITTKPQRPANRNDMQPFYTRKIFELLEARGRMPLGEIASELGLNRGTLISYLGTMRGAGIVCRDDYLDGKPLWTLGEEEAPPKKIGKPVGELHARQATVPARQVGMFRHWMDVALFGPAQGAAA